MFKWTLRAIQGVSKAFKRRCKRFQVHFRKFQGASGTLQGSFRRLTERLIAFKGFFKDFRSASYQGVSETPLNPRVFVNRSLKFLKCLQDPLKTLTDSK